MKNFWEVLPRPCVALAPMDDITDAPFRALVARHGKPHVMYTEFVSADGLMSAGREVLRRKLLYSEAERPVVAQIFGATPKNIEGAAALVRELGFDGVDLNMGCPDRAILKQGAGSALIEHAKRAREIVRAAHDGARDIPVSVKTRLGLREDVLETWLPELLAERPAAITIHCRTAKEMSHPPAHWDRIKDAVHIAHGSEVIILGNGDVWSLEEAHRRIQETGCDGIMIGRGAIGNPFVFGESAPTQDQLFRAMVEHAELYEATYGRDRHFEPIRKHLSKYIHRVRGAKLLRDRVLHARNAAEVREIVEHAILTP